jgi:hypothetical protein
LAPPPAPQQQELLPTTASLDDAAHIELQWPPRRPWAEVVLSKIGDTAEDIAVIARRTFTKELPG